MKNTIHNFERVYDQTIARIEKSEDFSEKNKRHVKKFISQLQLEGVGKAKAIRYLGDMFTLNRLLKIDFDLATKDDLKRVIGEIQSYTHWKEETKNSFKIMVRKLFRAIYDIDEKGVYPEQVKFIKLVSRVNNKTMFEILTDEEIKSLIRVTTNLRDKAFIALLAESGCRVSEIGTLQIKNVTFESGGARIIVHGKTGPRSILIIKSAPYLQLFINNHPDCDNPEAYLWHNGRGKLMTYHRIRDILASAKKKAGITKRVHPHLFRHTAATKMANFMTDNQLKKYMGWTSARMIGVYTHLSGKDTDDAVLKMNGLAVEEKKQNSILENHKCLRCNTINPSTNRCCSQCGLIISDEFAKETLIKESQRAEADELMNSLMKDPEVLEILKRKLHKPVRSIDWVQSES